MINRKSFLTVCAVVAAGLLTAGSAQVSTSPITRVNYLTFSKAVALPGVVLAAGAYTFEAGPGGVSRDIVLVRARDSQQPLYLGFTRPATRPVTLPINRPVEFGEAPAGEPTPIAAWFPIGETTGHQFLYR